MRQRQRPSLLDEGGVEVAEDDLPLELGTEAEVELSIVVAYGKPAWRSRFCVAALARATLSSSSKPCRKSA
jgi:hypothetical protein